MAGEHKLLSLRQVAEILGKSVATVRKAARNGRLTHCQLVDGYMYVVRDDFRVKPISKDDDLIKGLPLELISDVPAKHWSDLTTKEVQRGNPNPVGDDRKVQVPGFERVKEDLGLSMWGVYDLTGVHPITQRKMLNGQGIYPNVVLRLAKGLEVEVEELLKW